MINKHKKFLTAAVFCAIASTGFVLTASAEETMTHDLDEVVLSKLIKTPCPAAM